MRGMVSLLADAGIGTVLPDLGAVNTRDAGIEPGAR